MREIKFRCFEENKGMWGMDSNSAMNLAMFWAYVADIKGNPNVMQYTGLKDKNGVEIWENDILKISQEGRKMYDAVGSDGSGVAEYQVVGWKYGSWMTNRNAERLGEENTYLWILLPTCEVVGNLYENPDLLSPTE